MPVDTLIAPTEEAIVAPSEALDPHEQARHVLAESLALPVHTVARLEPRLDDLVDKAIASAADPQLQIALEKWRIVKRYELFGQPGDAPPKEIAFFKLVSQVHGPSYNSNGGFCSRCADKAYEAVSNRSKDELVAFERDCEAALESQKPNVKEALVAYLRTSPAIKYIATLGSVPSDTVDAPDLATITSLKAEIERKHGLSLTDDAGRSRQPNQDLATYLSTVRQANREFTVRMEMLEPQSHQRSRNTDSANPSPKRVWERTIHMLSLISGQKVTLKEVTKTDVELRYETGGSALLKAFLIVWDVRHQFPALKADSDEETRLNFELLANFLRRTAESGFREPFAKVLNAAIEQTATEALDRITSIKKRDGELGNLFRLVPEASIHLGRLHYSDYHYRAHKEWDTRTAGAEVKFYTREEEAESEKQIIGKFLKAPKNEPSRLLLSVDAAGLTTFETPGVNEEIRLLLNKGFKGRPHIPGYILTSAKNTDGGAVYGFARDPSGDPLARATMSIEAIERTKQAGESARLRLASKYRELGLHTLGDALEKIGDITVAQFVSLIKGETYYPKSSPKEPALPKSFSPTSLDDFAPIIRDKRLWAQCTGSGSFLEHSLRFLGFEDVGVVDGVLLNFEEHNITAVKHRQTYLNYGGRYLLDATGSRANRSHLVRIASSLGRPARAATDLLRRVGRTHAPPPESHAPVILPESQEANQPHPMTSEQQAGIAHRKIKEIQTSLDSSLMAFFDVRSNNRQGLLKRLSEYARSKGTDPENMIGSDPLYKAVSIASRASLGADAPRPVSIEEVANLSRTLSTLLERSTHRQYTAWPYSVLDTLHDHMTRLQKVLSQKQAFESPRS